VKCWQLYALLTERLPHSTAKPDICGWLSCACSAPEELDARGVLEKAEAVLRKASLGANKRIVEQRATTANASRITENHGVPGSNPGPATSKSPANSRKSQKVRSFGRTS
jgi:hypothetical protein